MKTMKMKSLLVAISMTISSSVFSVSRKLAIPSDVPPGNYYIIAVADGENMVDEGSGEGDFQAQMITISPATGENFYIYNLRNIEKTVKSGESIHMSFDYRYSGQVQNPSYTVLHYFLSKSTTLGSDKIFLGWDTGNNGGVPLSKSNSFRRFEDRELKIYSWIEPGQYYLHIVPDGDGAVSETDENDSKVIPLTVF